MYTILFLPGDSLEKETELDTHQKPQLCSQYRNHHDPDKVRKNVLPCALGLSRSIAHPHDDHHLVNRKTASIIVKVCNFSGCT
jgi:hypothetical protein